MRIKLVLAIIIAFVIYNVFLTQMLTFKNRSAFRWDRPSISQWTKSLREENPQLKVPTIAAYPQPTLEAKCANEEEQ